MRRSIIGSHLSLSLCLSLSLSLSLRTEGGHRKLFPRRGRTSCFANEPKSDGEKRNDFQQSSIHRSQKQPLIMAVSNTNLCDLCIMSAVAFTSVDTNELMAKKYPTSSAWERRGPELLPSKLFLADILPGKTDRLGGIMPKSRPIYFSSS